MTFYRVLIFLLLLGLMGCDGYRNEQNSKILDFTNELQLDLADDEYLFKTNFDSWDGLYIIRPYSNASEILSNNRIMNSKSVDHFNIEVRDDILLLVLVKNKTAIGQASLERKFCDIDQAETYINGNTISLKLKRDTDGKCTFEY